jgi:putative ABC transport system permease protein
MFPGLSFDFRYAFRGLRRSPGFSLAAVLTLAVGIGATTAMFSVVNGVLLRPLPYPEADRLVAVAAIAPEGGAGPDQLSFPNFRDLRTRSTTFTRLGAFRFWLFTIAGAREPETVLGIHASEALLSTLGVRPALGREFGPGSDEPGRPAEALLSDGLWQRQFGRDPGVLGRVVNIDGRPITIVGVLPAGFRFPDLTPADAPLPTREPDLMVSLGLEAQDLENRGNANYSVLGRLAPGIGFPAARAEVDRISEQLGREFPENDGRLRLTLSSLQQMVVGDAKGPLLFLLGAVGLVLLIACANVTGLLLARAMARRREFALRGALGATPGRMIRQLLTECLVLALAGGGLGVLFGYWGIDLVRYLAPNNVPRLGEVTLDGRILGFTLLVSIITGLLFGLTPALGAGRRAAGDTLKEGAWGSTVGGQGRLRGGLVIVEIGISLTLLFGAGLLLRSFVGLSRLDPGFDGSDVVSMLAILPPSRYPDAVSQRRFVDQALDRIGHLPGVEAAGVVNTLPLSNLGFSTSLVVPGHPAPPPGEEPSVPYRTVDGAYFEALRIRLSRGRLFQEWDTAGAPAVALLNEAGVRRFFPGEDPIGQRVQLGNDPGPRTVVGVVRDHLERGLDQPAVPEVYYPFRQGPDPIFTIVARSAADPRALLPGIRRELGRVDPLESIFMVRTIAELQAGSLERRRFGLQLLGAFAATALGLAAIGLYGLLTFSVSQRTREIGVRLALGATGASVLAMLFKEGMRLTAMGAAAGLVASAGLARLLQSQLFGIRMLDPIAVGGVGLILLGVAAIAILLPARRAARVDPIEALRAE